ncbi:MAG: hypothetical protein V4490_03250, partial [Pseudomonadota bacterium]
MSFFRAIGRLFGMKFSSDKEKSVALKETPEGKNDKDASTEIAVSFDDRKGNSEHLAQIYFDGPRTLQALWGGAQAYLRALNFQPGRDAVDPVSVGVRQKEGCLLPQLISANAASLKQGGQQRYYPQLFEAQKALLATYTEVLKGNTEEPTSAEYLAFKNEAAQRCAKTYSAWSYLKDELDTAKESTEPVHPHDLPISPICHWAALMIAKEAIYGDDGANPTPAQLSDFLRTYQSVRMYPDVHKAIDRYRYLYNYCPENDSTIKNIEDKFWCPAREIQGLQLLQYRYALMSAGNVLAQMNQNTENPSTDTLRSFLKLYATSMDPELLPRDLFNPNQDEAERVRIIQNIEDRLLIPARELPHSCALLHAGHSYSQIDLVRQMPGWENTDGTPDD